MMNGEICVPDAALSEAAENGEAVGPESGDEIEVTLKGPVTRREGGNIYFKPTSANGEPLPEAGPEKTMEEEDAEMADEMRRMDSGAGAASYVLAFLFLLAALLGGGEAVAQNIDLSWAKRKSVSSSPTTNVVFINSPIATITNSMQVFYVEQLNLSGAAGFAMVFDSYTNQLVNAAPQLCPKAVANGANVAFDFGPTGAPFYNGINVCLSTTPNTLTNAAGGGYVSIIWSPLQR